MNLLNQVLKEHSRANTTKIVKYVKDDPHRFGELVEVYLQGSYRVTQRAAWPLSYCVEQKPDLIYPHLSKVLNFLHKPGTHVAVKRNTIRLLQFVEVPKRLQGKVATICFDYLNNPKEPIAARIFSMTVLEKLSRQQPELKYELREIIAHHLPLGTAGFVSRATKVLKALKD